MVYPTNIVSYIYYEKAQILMYIKYVGPATQIFYARQDKMQAILDRFPDLDNLTAELQKVCLH